MRSLTAFLTDLRKRKIRLWLDGGDLRFSAPPGALAGPVLAELKARKGEVIAFFQKATVAQTSAIQAGSGDGRLSYAQERLWFLDQLEPGNPFYNVALTLRLEGTLHVGALQAGFDAIVARHEVLRTNFPAEDGKARLVVSEAKRVPLVHVDLSGLVGEAQTAELYRLAHEEARRPFDLAQDALLRVTILKLEEENHALFLTMHHIVSDGWSLGVLVQEVGAVYSAVVAGQTPQLPSLPIQYGDFAVWQQSAGYQERLDEQLRYWRERLVAIPPELALPTDRPRPPEQSFQGSSVTFTVGREVTARLQRLSQQEGSTLFMTLAAGLTALLYRYSHQNDILLGTPIANRTVPELEKLVGFFVNTLVLRSEVSAEMGFLDLLREMRKTALQAFSHQDLPFEMLVDALQPERDLSRNPIFQVMFALQNAPVDDLALPALRVRDLPMKRTAALFDWVLDMWEIQGQLTGVLEFNTDLFEQATIERFIGHFQMVLEGIVADPAQTVGALPLLPAAELQILLHDFAGPIRENYPLNETIHGLFEAQVARTPERVAVVHNGRSLTYAALNGRANQIANRLRATGVKNNDFVGILDERGVDFLTAILGIQKAGGAYLPIDPSYPVDRVQYMVSNSQVAWLITREAFASKVDLGETAVREMVMLDEAALWMGPTENLVHTTNGRDRAYMLYTSGSTGLPKGAIIRHDGALNHMYGEFELLDFDEDCAFLQSAPSSSDISVWQFLGPVLGGGRTVIADLEIVADPVALFQLIKRERITIVELVPVVLKGLLDYAGSLSAAEGALPDLVWAMVTGEAVQATLINQWLAMYPAVPIINAYGPTEAADDVTQHVMREPLVLDGRGVPVGKPLPNLQIFVVDKQMQIVPLGVTGEICVGGIGVGEGYWRNEEKTGESFVPLSRVLVNGEADSTSGWLGRRPATEQNESRVLVNGEAGSTSGWLGRRPATGGENPEAKSELVYRTGDRGRWLADGTLEYIERIDQQVKVRGFRIELGEIEGVLDQATGVEKSVTAVRPDAFGEKQLVAYVVAAQGEPGTDALEEEQVTLWQDLHEQSYSDTLLLDNDRFLNVIGWDSNYTNAPLPAEQMHEYIGDTVARAMALRPSRVLEIGCGTGMIAFQLLPQVEQYWGTDISEVAIAGLKKVQEERALQVRSPKLAGARFEARAADDFSGWAAGQFDLALLPSVVQYFPSVDYLREVLSGLARLLTDGGAIYVGDVRSLHLLEAFHASVQLHQADEGVTAAVLKQRVWQQLQNEQEMAIDPAFFVALADAVPEICGVEILPKRGWHQNEMTRFRYDVVLQVGKEGDRDREDGVYGRVARSGDRPQVGGESREGEDGVYGRVARSGDRPQVGGESREGEDGVYGRVARSGDRPQVGGESREGEVVYEWRDEMWGLEDIERVLGERDVMVLRGVANARVAAEMRLLPWLETAGAQETVAYFRAQLAVHGDEGLEPEAIWELGARLGFGVDMRVALGREDGAFDVRFERLGSDGSTSGWLGQETGRRLGRWGRIGVKPWWQYANNPLREKLSRGLVPQWREFLKGRLPGHMVPNQFVLLDKLPLTPNGKVDREGLPTPDPERRVSSQGYIAPTTEAETAMCQIWQDVLGVPQVGIQDNFFDLGGHSLKATQVISRIQRDLGVQLPLRTLFNSPTVGELAGQIAGEKTAVLARIPRQPEREDYPLSHAQHRLWVLSQMGGEGLAAYNMPAALLWRGLLDQTALQAAFDRLAARHEVLRTTFGVRDGEPYQRVHGALSISIDFVDLRGDVDQRERAQRLAAEDAKRPFDLVAGPLMRLTVLQLAADQHVLLLNLHHIVSDAWSEGVLMREFTQLYEGARQGREVALPALPIQYRDYAVWQMGYLAGEQGVADGSFWQTELAGELPVLDFPTDFARPSVKTYRGASHSIKLTSAQTAGLQALSRQQDVTLFMTLTALVQTLLYRHTGQEDILLGTPVHGRGHPDLEQQVGFYINTVVLRQEVVGTVPFSTFLQQVKAGITAAFDHQDYPFDRLVQELNLQRDVSRNPVFDAAIVYQSVAPETAGLSGVEIGPFVTEYEGSKFDLSFTFEPHGEDGGLQLDIIFNTDLYRPERMARLGGHFEMLVGSVLGDGERPLDGLTILPERERLVIEGFGRRDRDRDREVDRVYGWVARSGDRPQVGDREGARSGDRPQIRVEREEREENTGKESLVGWFEAQVVRTPERVAVQFEGVSLSYAALNRRANQVAHLLVARGVERETLVGLFMERSLEMVVAILGILKAGGAYVPFDPASPTERLAFMLADTEAPILLTQRSLQERLGTGLVEQLLLDDVAIDAQADHNLGVLVGADDLAYIIYTSGSTGRPKGVMVTHGNATRLFSSTDEWYRFNEEDVWTLFHSIAFDFSVWEIWGALLYGGRLVVVPYWVSRAPDAFYELVAREGVTVLNQTPSAFRQFMGMDGQKGAELALRSVIFGGEALDIPGLRPWFERHGDERPQLVNMYGITETTVHVTYRPIGMVDVENRASVIGEAIPDLTLHILDKMGRPSPIGVAGEMVVGGAGVARGYLRRPELTAERFVAGGGEKRVESRDGGSLYEWVARSGDRPQVGGEGERGERLYRTGDLGRWLANGDIEYLGRIDTQVKVRGFRIELGEIEAVLGEAEGVEAAVVLVHDDGHGQQLIGYVVGGEQIDVGAVRQVAQGKLPGYMVPAVLMPIAQLPLTANGKLDRRALPTPTIVGERAGEVVAPTTALQQQIAAVWQGVLGLNEVGIEENFFDLGGDSLRIIQVHQKLTEEHRLAVDVVALFQYPTIQALAEQLEKAAVASDTAADTTVTAEAGSRAARAKAARAKRNRRRK